MTNELNVPLARFLGLNVPRMEPAEFTIGEVPCSPRMQSHQHNQRKLNAPQPKHWPKNARSCTLVASSGGSSIYSGRGERSQSTSHPTSHPHLKKDWLLNSVTSVKGALRKRNSGTPKFDSLSSSASVPDFSSVAYRDSNSKGSRMRRICAPSHNVRFIE